MFTCSKWKVKINKWDEDFWIVGSIVCSEYDWRKITQFH